MSPFCTLSLKAPLGLRVGRRWSVNGSSCAVCSNSLAAVHHACEAVSRACARIWAGRVRVEGRVGGAAWGRVGGGRVGGRVGGQGGWWGAGWGRGPVGRCAVKILLSPHSHGTGVAARPHGRSHPSNTDVAGRSARCYPRPPPTIRLALDVIIRWEALETRPSWGTVVRGLVRSLHLSELNELRRARDTRHVEQGGVGFEARR